jgi:hypothetical protein
MYRVYCFINGYRYYYCHITQTHWTQWPRCANKMDLSDAQRIARVEDAHYEGVPE